MMSEPVSSPPRRWRKRLLWLAVLPVLLLGGFIWHSGPKWRLITDIRFAGGRYREYYAASLIERTLAPLLRLPVRVERTVVLQGPEFDDDWLIEHDDLAALEFNELSIDGTRLSRESIHRLLQKHHVTCLGLANVPFSDEEAKLLEDNTDLHFVVLRGTDMTDEGFAALNLSGVFLLHVPESPVTAAALERQLAGRSIKFLGLDGRQFSPELAKFLGTIPTLQIIDLVGPEITDEHLDLLKLIPSLRGISLDQTEVSDEAIEQLRSAHPQLGLRVDGVQVK